MDPATRDAALAYANAAIAAFMAPRERPDFRESQIRLGRSAIGQLRKTRDFNKRCFGHSNWRAEWQRYVCATLAETRWRRDLIRRRKDA